MGSGISTKYVVGLGETGIRMEVSVSWEDGARDRVIVNVFGPADPATGLYAHGKQISICKCIAGMPGMAGEVARWERHTLAECQHCAPLKLRVEYQYKVEPVAAEEARKVIAILRMAESKDEDIRNAGARLIRGFDLPYEVNAEDAALLEVTG